MKPVDTKITKTPNKYISKWKREHPETIRDARPKRHGVGPDHHIYGRHGQGR